MAGDDEGIWKSDTLFYGYDTTRKVTTVETACGVVKCIVWENEELWARFKRERSLFFFLNYTFGFQQFLTRHSYLFICKRTRLLHWSGDKASDTCKWEQSLLKKKKCFFFFCLLLSWAAVIWPLWPACLLTKFTSVVGWEDQALPFRFCDCKYSCFSAWKWLLYSDHVLLRPSFFVVFLHLF